MTMSKKQQKEVGSDKFYFEPKPMNETITDDQKLVAEAAEVAEEAARLKRLK